jgi:hypothetical protein
MVPVGSGGGAGSGGSSAPTRWPVDARPDPAVAPAGLPRHRPISAARASSSMVVRRVRVGHRLHNPSVPAQDRSGVTRRWPGCVGPPDQGGEDRPVGPVKPVSGWCGADGDPYRSTTAQRPWMRPRPVSRTSRAADQYNSRSVTRRSCPTADDRRSPLVSMPRSGPPARRRSWRRHPAAPSARHQRPLQGVGRRIF